MNNRLRIKDIIKERGMTVSEFADMLGIERQNVYNVFTKPSFQRLEQCSKILNVPISDLFEKEDSEISGFIEYKGVIYRINGIDSLLKITRLIEQ